MSISSISKQFWRWKLAYSRLPLAIRSLARVLGVFLAVLMFFAGIFCLMAYSVKAFIVAVGVVFFVFVWRIAYEEMR